MTCRIGSHGSLSTSFRTPIRSRRRFCCCSSADDDAIDQWTDARPIPGKLFIVGDPKQAIYRFRGADVGTYWSVRNHLAACGGRLLQLTTNFRSVPAIQRFVNRAFEQEMNANDVALQAGYVPLAERRPADESQPAVVALPVPAPYSTGRLYGNAVTGRAVEASLPDAVGAFVEWLVHDSGWQVRGTPGRWRRRARVGIEPRHIAVLFRRFTSYAEDMTRPYIERSGSARAFRICSSAARRSTTARKSRRFARLWRPSSGPTTSCRCSRR